MQTNAHIDFPKKKTLKPLCDVISRNWGSLWEFVGFRSFSRKSTQKFLNKSHSPQNHCTKWTGAKKKINKNPYFHAAHSWKMEDGRHNDLNGELGRIWRGRKCWVWGMCRRKARRPTDCFLEDGKAIFLDPPRVNIWFLSGKHKNHCWFLFFLTSISI